jgi:hypothetical protein
VVLDEVAQRARAVVVAGARADPDVLGRRDLDVVDVVAVPDRLEHVVREPERHHVLDRLLAQVVVDAEDLALAERRVHDLLEAPRRCEVGAERLLDHDPHVRALVVVEPVGLERLGDDREVLRRRRQVVDAVEREARLLVQRVARRADLRVPLRVVERVTDVGHPLDQPVEHRLGGLAARELGDRLARLPTELVVRQLAARDADQVEALGQRPLVGQVVEGGQELAAREVARGAEDDQRGRRNGEPLEALDQRVLGGDHCHLSRPLPPARPRGRRTGCAARRAPCACTRLRRASRSARRARR